jgi:hypothetical protein
MQNFTLMHYRTMSYTYCCCVGKTCYDIYTAPRNLRISPKVRSFSLNPILFLSIYSLLYVLRKPDNYFAQKIPVPLKITKIVLKSQF